jgi:tripartite ATP-independent transporter DctP family solute receptor
MKKSLGFAMVLACVLGITVTARVSAAPAFTITMATPSNPEDNCVKAFFKFKELVEERSKGRLAVDVKHTGQLGAHRDYIEQLQMGSLQAAEINVAVLSAVDPKFMVFDLPYISQSQKWLEDRLEGDLGKAFTDSLEKSAGIRIIGWMVRSPRDMYISSRPVVTASDFKGMKVRIMESPVMRRTFELLEAVPVPLTANERYMALQTRVVDAAENSVSLIITQKEHEVTKYVSLTEHFISPNIIAFDPKFFARLPADLQDIVAKAGNEAGHYATKLDAESEKSALDELKKLGMTINDCPDKSSFQQKVAPIYAEYRDRIGAGVIDAFMK